MMEKEKCKTVPPFINLELDKEASLMTAYLPNLAFSLKRQEPVCRVRLRSGRVACCPQVEETRVFQRYSFGQPRSKLAFLQVGDVSLMTISRQRFLKLPPRMQKTILVSCRGVALEELRVIGKLGELRVAS